MIKEYRYEGLDFYDPNGDWMKMDAILDVMNQTIRLQDELASSERMPETRRVLVNDLIIERQKLEAQIAKLANGDY